MSDKDRDLERKQWRPDREDFSKQHDQSKKPENRTEVSFDKPRPVRPAQQED